MRWLLDLLYLLGAMTTSPVWLTKMVRTGKIRTDWPGRLGRVVRPLPAKAAGRKRLLFHAVSVGEINAIRQLVDRMAAAGDAEIVIAVTTDTGFARAMALWGDGKHAIVRYPLDFSWSVARFLRAVRPDVVALTELEVWPNFASACKRSGVALCVINGRLTERSFKRYRLVRGIMRPAFESLAFAAVQNEAYAARFRGMGARADRVRITGTMKWDTAQIADRVDGADQLAREMGIDQSKPLIVAGSTAPGEHELLHAATPEGVQLLCAPRKPEWFDQAAAALGDCVRRTHAQTLHEATSVAGANVANRQSSIINRQSDRYLLDTIGELRMAYSLADVIVVGRTFGDLHGSDMMEPAALGKAVIVGPAVRDFQDSADALIAGEGLVQTTAAELPAVIKRLLHDRDERHRLAANARRVIIANQGATDRHIALVRSLLKMNEATDESGWVE